MRTATQHLTAARGRAVARVLGILVLLVALPADTGTNSGAARRRCYMGDGISDAPALHAVDVAKEAADIVLLEPDLAVLEAEVREGRRTFANTLKYVFMATSANFGNMFSMAGTSLLLPFLPLLPTQILLNNLLTDILWLRPVATALSRADGVDRAGLRSECRVGETLVLQGRAPLIGLL